MSNRPDNAADVLTIFGISGDLAKKMTFRALYRLEAAGRLETPIVGVAIDDWDDERLRSHAHDSIVATVEEPDEEVFSRLAARLTYVQGDYADAATFERVRDALGDAERPVFYLEIPPSLFATVVKGLGDAGLTEGAHVVIEKPFGHDLASARKLNAELCAVLDEDQILRIDHYLGKEPVMDITYLRFVNSILEPVWNREHVSHVQLTIAENFGVDDRGRFYDAVGAMRDVIQNHALQVLALVGMGPPTGNHQDSIRDKKLEFFKAMRAADPKRYVRGQYEGFLDVKDVAPDSTTETFAAVELEVDNWRWSGVPFFVRAGKCLPAKASEVSIVFKRPPQPRHRPWQDAGAEPDDGADRAAAGIPHAAVRQESGRGGFRAGRPRGALRKEAGSRTPSHTSACSATRSPAATNSSPARTQSKRPGGWCSRCSTNRGRPTPTRRGPGARSRPTTSPAGSPSGRNRGCPNPCPPTCWVFRGPPPGRLR